MAETGSQAQSLLERVEACVAAGQDSQGGAQEAVTRTIELLNALERSKVTTQLLKETAAGKRIRKLTKHPNSDIVAAAIKVVEAWKDAVRLEQSLDATVRNGGEAISTSVFTMSQDPSEDEPQSKRPKSASLTPSVSGGLLSVGDTKRSLPPVVPSGNADRDKVRGLLAEALVLALPDAPGSDVAGVAAEVEEAMHRHCGGVKSMQYKTKYRSLKFNLVDPNNPDLRRRVLSREIVGEVLVKMKPEELASDARKQDNSKIRENALFEAERGQNLKKATTDQFQCGKCKQRKTTYFQMQTRSADEPMTTFVTCVNCGNRWKFC